LQPERASDPALLQAVKHIAPDVGVVVAYGHILKSELLQIPRRGMVNVHPSLLPELRGAAPIEWALLNGDETTGVTIMQMDVELDAGPVLHRLPHRIDPGTTGGELSDHLAEMGAQALIEALSLWERDSLRPVPQDHALATYAPKLTREIARIDWTKPRDVIVRQTLALDPRPGAWTELDGHEVKLFEGSVAPEGASGAAGDVLPADDRLLIAAGAGGGAVEVAEVQPAGKARMPAAEWMRGRGVTAGQRFV
jgi:methionyl-tRNA formyltransferase